MKLNKKRLVKLAAGIIFGGAAGIGVSLLYAQVGVT